MDYYTVISNNEDYKLSINKFIKKQEINSVKNENNIVFKVKDKTVFNNYEIYNIEVLNNSTDEIILDDLQDAKNIYVQDENENKYFWFCSEYIKDNLTLKSGIGKNISIKINKPYYSSSDSKKLVLEKMIISNKKNVKVYIDL